MVIDSYEEKRDITTPQEFDDDTYREVYTYSIKDDESKRKKSFAELSRDKLKQHFIG